MARPLMESQRRQKRFWKIIKSNMPLQGIDTQKQLAGRILMPYSTWLTRKSVDDFKGDELTRLFKVLKLADSEILEVMKI